MEKDMAHCKKSIRSKLTAAMLGLIVAVAMILTFTQISLHKEILGKELDKRIVLMKEKLASRGETLAANLAEQVQNNIATLNFSGAAELLRKVVDEDRYLHYAILMDSSRTAWLHTLQPDLEQETLAETQDIFAASQKQKNVQEYPLGNTTILEFITPIQVSAQPWGVLRLGFMLDLLNREIAISRSEIFQQTHNSVTRAIIFTTLILLVGVIIVAIISNRLTKPLRTLTHLAHELGKGNFAAGANIQANIDDEVGMLTHAFVDMSKELAASYDKLEDYNRTLEQQIKNRTEQLAEARDQAISANNSKSEFISMVSHEIRTPISAILGLAHLTLQTTLTTRQHDYQTKLQSSAHTLLSIISDILDFSKIEANKLEIERVPFNIADVLDHLSTYVGILAAEKGLEIYVSLAEDVPTLLIGDPLRLGQVLLNLVNNAVKFTEHGEVVVKVESIKDFQPADTIKLEFTVQDSGIGLSEEHIGKLFQPFGQADGSTTRKYGGTGLGLAICKRLVSLMHGDIGVTSELGCGSRFAFTAQFGVQAVTARKPLPSSLQSIKVLVVDDCAISRNILQADLQSFSLEVVLASSGAEAIRLLEQQADDQRPIELVLMDWKMPDMDGITTARIIKENPRIAHTPIIMMVTAYARDDIIRQARDLQLDGFLVKPVSPSLLYDNIIARFGQSSVDQTIVPQPVAGQNTALAAVKGAHLLLVEDHPINQLVATEILRREGFDVTIADNGQEAVEKVDQHRFDAVLMDLQMPIMDGYAATETIRANPRHANLPIIAMSAHVMAKEKEKCRIVGMNGYVDKPINLDKLFEILAARILTIKPPTITNPGETHLPTVLPGLDIRQGVDNVAGNSALYRKLLIEFDKDFCLACRQIQQFLQDGNDDAAQKLAHALKGVAGNLAATELQQCAGKLLTAIGQRSDMAQQLTLCRLALDTVIASVRRLGNATVEPKTADRMLSQAELENINALLTKLGGLIHDNRLDVDRGFVELKQYVSNFGHSDHIERLGTALDGFDFGTAHTVLVELKRNIMLKDAVL